MRLESQHQSATGEGAARCRQRCRHFHRVMAIVIDQCEVAAGRAGYFAVTLEAPTDTLELGQRLDDRGIGHLHLGRYGNGRQRIQYVVHPGQIERHRKATDAAVDAHAVEPHLAVGSDDVFRMHIGFRVQTVGHDLLRDPRHDFAHIRVIGTEHGNAVERQALQEIDESPLQPLEVMAVGFHVVSVDVGDNRNHRAQKKE